MQIRYAVYVYRYRVYDARKSKALTMMPAKYYTHLASSREDSSLSSSSMLFASAKRIPSSPSHGFFSKDLANAVGMKFILFINSTLNIQRKKKVIK